MIETCTCPACGGALEFDPLEAGNSVGCPHCNAEMVLPRPVSLRPRRRKSEWWKFLAAIGFTALMALLVLLWVNYAATQGDGLDITRSIGGAGMAILALAAFCAVVALAVLWIAFPVFVYYGMRRMEALALEIERNTRKL